MVCHNPLLEEERRRKRQALLEATEKSLEKIGKEVARRKKEPLQADEIGVKVGKVLGRYKVGKHFDYQIGEGRLAWSRRQGSIEQEEKLDGIYVLRTSEPVERLSAEETVWSYKSLAEVGWAFRCLKGIDLLVRPIRHRSEDGVPAHIFLWVLAYYVEWHLRRAWAPLLFGEEARREEWKHRDPILPAKPSACVQRKKRWHQTVDGLPVHSFKGLLSELASRARVTYTLKSGKSEEKSNLTFQQVPEPTPVQARAYELVRTFPVIGK
jgi:transposase